MFMTMLCLGSLVWTGPADGLIERLRVDGPVATAEVLRESDPLPVEEIASLIEAALREDRASDAVLVARTWALIAPRCAARQRRLAEVYERVGRLRWARFAYLRAASLTHDDADLSKELLAVAARVAAAIPDVGVPLRGTPGRALRVLAVLDVGRGDVVADIGCGNGWLAAEVAKVVGPDGKVYALEISDRVEILSKRGIANLIPVHSRPDDVTLEANSIDLAFLHDVATHVQTTVRPKFYASVARALRPYGSLVVFGAHGGMPQNLRELASFGFHPEPDQGLEGLEGKASDRRFWQGVRLYYRAPKKVSEGIPL